MIFKRKTKQSLVLPRLQLGLVRCAVVRPRCIERFDTWAEALDAIRPWVALGEAERIFERTFLI